MSLNVYRIEGRTLAPVVIKRNRQSQRSESLGAINGSALRGALAAEYLRQHGVADDTFRMLFLDPHSCRFGPLCPGPIALPATAAACKRHGPRHGFVDLLWFRMLQHLVGPRSSIRSLSRWYTCRTQGCSADLKAYTGFATRGENGLRASNATMFTSTHVGIDRLTGTAAESILYTLEAIVPETRLIGYVRATDVAVQKLRDLLHAADHVVYLGHHRTRGYGCVELHLEDSTEPTAQDDRDRWLQWSRDFIDFARRWAKEIDSAAIRELDDHTDFFFALGLPNGAIFVDQVLRYTLDPSEHIPWLPPLPQPERLYPLQRRPTRPTANGGRLLCLAAVIDHELLRGWHAAHGLPKQDEAMVSPGAVYAYWFRGRDPDRQELLQQLSALVPTGIGLRRNEGFGEVTISDEFHRQYA